MPWVEGSHRCQRGGRTIPARVAGMSWTAARAFAASSIQNLRSAGCISGRPGRAVMTMAGASNQSPSLSMTTGSGVATPAPDTTVRLSNSDRASSGLSAQTFTTKRS